MNQSLPSGRESEASAFMFERWSPGGTRHSLSDAAETLARGMRESLGLPARVAAGAGHQPILWHAGILAKFLAASAIARSCVEAPNWVHFLSDQDVVDPFRMDVPLRAGDGRVRRASIRLVASDPLRAREAIGAARPAQKAREIDSHEFASEHAVEGCKRVCTALDEFHNDPHAGVQLAHVMHACAAQWLHEPCAVVPSEALIASGAAHAILDRILSDPVACASAFNAALRNDPRAARPLHIAGESTEVPLWGVAADGRRERIGASEARRRRVQGRVLLPRAFLASGFMRVICETFVHGTGGARYERVGEAWWRDFLGIELPPFATASATLYPTPAALGLREDSGAPNPIAWRSAWWDPTQLDVRSNRSREGRANIDPVRGEILERIAQAPRRSAARREGYRSLCAYIEALRVSHSGELEGLARGESQEQENRGERALLRDRTWPFVMLADSAIDAMARTITQRISAPAAPLA